MLRKENVKLQGGRIWRKRTSTVSRARPLNRADWVPAHLRADNPDSLAANANPIAAQRRHSRRKKPQYKERAKAGRLGETLRAARCASDRWK